MDFQTILLIVNVITTLSLIIIVFYMGLKFEELIIDNKSIIEEAEIETLITDVSIIKANVSNIPIMYAVTKGLDKQLFDRVSSILDNAEYFITEIDYFPEDSQVNMNNIKDECFRLYQNNLIPEYLITGTKISKIISERVNYNFEEHYHFIEANNVILKVKQDENIKDRILFASKYNDSFMDSIHVRESI